MMRSGGSERETHGGSVLGGGSVLREHIEDRTEGLEDLGDSGLIDPGLSLALEELEMKRLLFALVPQEGYRELEVFGGVVAPHFVDALFLHELVLGHWNADDTDVLHRLDELVPWEYLH